MGNDRKSRIGIYSFSDKDGIADEYIAFFLDKLTNIVDSLIIVTNHQPTEKSLEMFATFNARVTENKAAVHPYATGLKFAMEDKSAVFNEVVFCSDRIIGPFYPLKDVFDEMDKVEADAWGITKEPFLSNWQYKTPYFLVCRKRLIDSAEFISLLDHPSGTKLTLRERINNAGYTWKAYVKTDDIDYLNPALINFYPKELIGKRKCPFLLTDIFSLPYLNVCQDTNDEEKLDLISFIEGTCGYSSDLIWEHVLRTCHLRDFVRNLHLNYVLPTQARITNTEITPSQRMKIALIIHLYYPAMIPLMRQYAASIPEDADVFITINNESIRGQVEQQFSDLPCSHFSIRKVENRGRNESAFLVGMRDVIHNYDLVCFVHDKKSSYAFPGSVGDSFLKFCLENTLGSKAYVSNLISLFAAYPRLGISCLPPMLQGMFYELNGNGWTVCYPEAEKLTKELRLNVPLSQNVQTIMPWGGMFWIRTEALKIIERKDWKYEDFPDESQKISDGSIMHALERIWALTVQQAGYYPAIILSDRAARLQFTNTQFYLSELNRTLMDDGINLGSGFYAVLHQLKMPGHLPLQKLTKLLDHISNLKAEVQDHPHSGWLALAL